MSDSRTQHGELRLALSVIVAVFFAYIFVRSAIDRDWTGAGIFGGFLLVYIVMIVWRVRSGIPTWSFLATVVGLLGNIRPTRSGLVRKGENPSPDRQQQPVAESFDSMTRRLHATVKPTRPTPTTYEPDPSE